MRHHRIFLSFSSHYIVYWRPEVPPLQFLGHQQRSIKVPNYFPLHYHTYCVAYPSVLHKFVLLFYYYRTLQPVFSLFFVIFIITQIYVCTVLFSCCPDFLFNHGRQSQRIANQEFHCAVQIVLCVYSNKALIFKILVPFLKWELS